MLKGKMNDIIDNHKKIGWVLEPEAKRLIKTAGLKVPSYIWAKKKQEAVNFAAKSGYPVVAKVVSPSVVHKSDVGGVVVGIDSDDKLEKTYDDFSAMDGFSGMLVEEMVSGLELIIGAQIDYQFGPVVLLGIGGTGVEIYRDVTMRMAPLNKTDVTSMVDSLRGSRIIKGYRGSESVNIGELTDLLIKFSDLIMKLEKDIQSIDLNPVICSSDKCLIADARIMLAE